MESSFTCLPKQRFPPAVIRFDYKQLQFHHICRRCSRHIILSSDARSNTNLESFPPSRILCECSTIQGATCERPNSRLSINQKQNAHICRWLTNRKNIAQTSINFLYLFKNRCTLFEISQYMYHAPGYTMMKFLRFYLPIDC